MRRIRLAIDVDGPSAAMIDAFLGWVNNPSRCMNWSIPTITRDMIVFHNDMGASPLLQEVDRILRGWYPEPGPNGGLGGAFLQFMRYPRVYSDFVRPTEGAQEAIRVLSSRCDCLFVTALMKRANQHVPDKLDWIGNNFPGIAIATVPSEYKCWVRADFGIDDRYDTCNRWFQEGTEPLMFGTPWSEAPERGTIFGPHDWTSILRTVEAYIDREESKNG